MEIEKYNKGIILLITILIVLVIGLAGYIVYDKVVFSFEEEVKETEKENDKENEKENELNNVQGIRETDGKIVYDYNKTWGWINALIVDNDGLKVEVKEIKTIYEESEIEYQAVYINGKKIINEEEIFAMSSFVSIDEFIVFPNGDIMVQYTENAEVISSRYFFIYNKGENYIDLSNISKFNDISKIKINEKNWTIISDDYFFVDVLCLDYKDSDIIYVQETFEYLGNGKFDLVITKEKTVLDIRKENGYKSCAAETN